MVIMDSSAWIDYLGGVQSSQTAWLEREMGAQRIGLTDITLCEVLQGVRNDAVFRRVRNLLMDFDVFDSGGVELAVAAARNYRTLRTGGHTVRKTNPLRDCNLLN
jgi:predicted nucleic acid-binding protein